MQFSTDVNGDPWDSPPMSDGPVATVMGAATGEQTGGTGTLEADVDTAAVTSPLSAWLDSSRWSREDLRLLTDLIGAIGTLGFLYFAVTGVSA